MTERQRGAVHRVCGRVRPSFVAGKGNGTLASASARGAAVTLGAQLSRLVLTVTSTTVLARLLMPGDYGIVGMAAAVTQFVGLFKDLGLSAATIQRERIDHNEISALFWINVGISMILTGVTLVAAPLVSSFFGEPRLTAVVSALGIGIVISGCGVQHQALLNRQMRFEAIAVVEVASLVLGFAMAATLAWQGWGYWALIGSSLVTMLFGTLGALWCCRWVPGRPSFASGAIEMLRFGSGLTGFSLVNYFARNADNVLIGRYWGASELGIYDRAYQLLLLPIAQINNPIGGVALPLLSRLVQEPQLYERTYLRVLEKVSLVTAPSMVFLTLTSDLVIDVLLGARWTEVSPVFACLGVVGIVQPITNTSGWLFMSQARTSEMFRFGLFSSGVLVLAIAVGLPWGARGVALSYAVAGVLLAPVIFWYATRSGPVALRGVVEALATPAWVSATVGAVLGTCRLLFRGELFSSIVTLSVCVLLATAATAAVLLGTARGRSALFDLLALARLAKGNAVAGDVEGVEGAP